MSVSKTKFFLGIGYLFKEMLKIFTNLSKKTELVELQTKIVQRKIDNVKMTQDVIASQLLNISRTQSEIAKQVLKQNEQTEYLYQILGLKKDLSHYSFNMMDAEEH